MALSMYSPRSTSATRKAPTAIEGTRHTGEISLRRAKGRLELWVDGAIWEVFDFFQVLVADYQAAITISYGS